MRLSCVIIICCSVLTFVSASTAAELGVDLGGTLQLVDHDDRSILLIGAPSSDGIGVFPLQSFRLGFPTSTVGQFETNLGLSVLSVEQTDGGHRTLAHLQLGISYLHSLGDPSTTVAPYLRAGPAMRQVAATDKSLASQYGLAAAIGVRRRVGTVFGYRIEFGATRWVDNDDYAGHTDLSMRLGLSAFSH